MFGSTDYKGIPKLTKINYSVWKRAVRMMLMSKRCLEIVERTEDEPEPPMPLGDSADLAEIKEYNRSLERFQDRWDAYRARLGEAGNIINHSLTKEAESYVKSTTDPAEMWDILKERMDSTDNPVLQRNIRRDFDTIQHDGKETVEKYITKLRDFQRALEETDDPISDKAIMSKILVSLPPAWEIKIAAIEDDPLLTLDKLERVLCNYQGKIAAIKAKDVALTTRGRGGYRGRGRGRGGNRGAYQGTMDKVTDGRITKDVECYHCLQKGHYQATCPLKIEAEEKRKERKAAWEQANVATKTEDVDREEEISFMVKHYLDEPVNDWVLDSGATGHMCFDRTAFENLKRLPQTRQVYLGDGSGVGAYGIGTV